MCIQCVSSIKSLTQWGGGWRWKVYVVMVEEDQLEGEKDGRRKLKKIDGTRGRGLREVTEDVTP